MPTLDFKGKQFIYGHHLTVPIRTLEMDTDKSLTGEEQPSLDDNLIIHGNNLDALKALMPHYAGRIKCIYIDPPYNTGKEGWIYNDNVNSPQAKAWLEKNSPIDVEDMERHDKWLFMMWPRLHLLRELLTEDGAIFISIDDNEVHRLRAIMDEIFDAKEIFPNGNFVGQFIWAARIKNNSRLFSNSHDYILCYLKNHKYLNEQQTSWRVRKQGLDNVYKKHAELKREHGQDFSKIEKELAAWFRGLSDADPAKRHKDYHYVDNRGLYSSTSTSPPVSGKDRYPVMHPITNKPCTVPINGWRYTQRKMNKLIADDRILFGADEKTVPRRKHYLKETEHETPYSVFYKDAQGATQRLNKLLGNVFPFPKDEGVLKLIFEAATGPNDIILDSFAGSGTTAHAILDLNKEDGGNRKFILVECEDYADNITAERVRRVINGVENARDQALREGFGGTFTYCTLGDPIDEEGMLTGEKLPTYETLASYIVATATGKALPEIVKQPDFFFGEIEGIRFYLIYEPTIEFLDGTESPLDASRAEQIAEECQASGKKAYVYATHKFISQKELSGMNITFCQLPYNIYRITE